MKRLAGFFLISFLCVAVSAQSDREAMIGVERALVQRADQNEMRSAFLDFLSDDSIVFRPNATNGKEFWKKYSEDVPMVLDRHSIDSDVSSNGMLGYTTGNWRLYPRGKDDEAGRFGEYVTIWEKRGGKFLATVDITISHDKFTSAETDKISAVPKTSEPNPLGWSVADASMNFLRAGMEKEGLAGAYKRFGTDGIRLLIEREPPILGKKNVSKAMRIYKSIEFPKHVALFQAADMAYTWNACQFANSDEGTESGNCLQVWKLHDKKWWIVLSVYARITNDAKPSLKTREKNKRTN